MRLLTHIRHSRGYGIHSPFVYRLVRDVMMRRDFEGDDRKLYDALRVQGVGRSTARKLQNYLTHYHCSRWTLNSDAEPTEGELSVFTPDKAAEAALMAANAVDKTVTLCLLSPRHCREKARQMIEKHNNTSVENLTMILLFFGGQRPKQHIII